jgi:hypothetical protein
VTREEEAGGDSNLPATRDAKPPATKPGGPPATTGPKQPATPAGQTPGQQAGGSSVPYDPTAKWTPPTSTGVTEVDPPQLDAAAKKVMSRREDFITACGAGARTLAGSCYDMAGKDYVGM